MLADGILLGCGNPLLDIQAVVDKQFLNEWNLKENDAILADNHHIPMLENLIEKYDVKYLPGGATLNALRVCQWILKRPKLIVFFGTIGNDKYGELLRDKALHDGVNASFQINPNMKSGTCAVLINERNRSLCAHLAAAETFTIEHIRKSENEKFIENAKFYYISGFFLTVCPEAVLTIGKHAAQNNKTFMMNLAAPFISSLFLEELMKSLEYTDVLFGNDDEVLAFAKANKYAGEDIKDIGLWIAALPKLNTQANRIVIVTRGENSTLVFQNGQMEEFKVAKISADEIVDTNGAGDAFVGGFLSQFIQEKSLRESVEFAHFTASVILRQYGCTLPSDCKYN